MKKEKGNKKIMISIIAVISTLITIVILIVNFKTNKITCKNESIQKTNGYKIENTYDIISDNEIVKKVIIKETVISKRNEILKSFEKQYKKQYKYNKKAYGGYTYRTNNKKGKLEVEVTVDFNKIDIEKFVTDNEAMKQFVYNSKFTLEGAKKLYETTGAKCT